MPEDFDPSPRSEGTRIGPKTGPKPPRGRAEAVARSLREHHKGKAILGVLMRGVEALSVPSMGVGLLIAVLVATIFTLCALWTRERPLVAVGRVMNETRLVRREIRTVDDAQTKQRQEAARQATPRVYAIDQTALDAIITSIDNLPKTVAGAETIDGVDQGIREQFGLTPEGLAALKAEWAGGQRGPEWADKVRQLAALLARRPLLDAQTWQRGSQEGTSGKIRLFAADKTSTYVLRGEAVNLEDKDQLASVARVMARDSNFSGLIRQIIATRLTNVSKPTYTFDGATTTKDQNAAAEQVLPAVTISPVGQIIFRRGDVLTEPQATLFRAEMALNEHEADGWQKWFYRAGVLGVMTAITLVLAGYTVLFCPRVKRNAARMMGVATVLMACMATSCFATAASPEYAALTIVTPTILVAMLMTIAYDRRAALAYALMEGLAVCVAVRAGIGTMGVMVAGIACVVWSLKEIRDRGSLVRASAFAAIGVGLTTIVVGLVERPLVGEVISEILVDGAKAAGGAIAVGGATLFMLPMIERAFKVTTGLTLIELRDPKQPLLKELQQRAPGTYTHSLNVATIAEAAAEAIGCDGLLTYVGSLYHDIGKMNKPEYFVENQQGGPNKHDRLTPAMSLLIIVGHVKDGMELAREFNLPAKLQHFIEAHHGTTLVEFFYHRAKKKAEGEEEPNVPDEFEYRYPGPKPRIKEVAILMIADAVESAARAMNDPTPTRIDALVRSIANKRLMDGQFDDCEITLKDLSRIVDSVSRTVASMHHGRISYPEAAPQAAAQ
ncbi:MAG: HDIG domain-containing protein [Tepidisphaera sp.]|nr:HDIG domain-containing protein [Tepidisphaera sp.]